MKRRDLMVTRNEARPPVHFIPARLFVVGLTLLFLLTPSLVFAADVKQYGPSYTIPYWINFLLFLVLVYFVLRKPFVAFWAKRRADIEASLNRGAEELEKAKRMLDEVRNLHATLEARKEEIRERIQSDALNEEKAALADGRAAAEYIAESARQNIDAERARTIGRMRRELAEKVLGLAEAKARSELNGDSDRRLRDISLTDLHSFRAARDKNQLGTSGGGAST